MLPRAMISARFDALRTSDFVRSVSVLMGGTVFAQALTVATMPILTRLYAPADFNLLAVLAGVIAIVGVVSCLRYDVAIAVPDSDDEAMALLVLSVSISVAVGAVSAIPIIVAPEAILRLLGQPKLGPWLWMLPVGIALYGTCIALQMWFVRAKRFGDVARSRMGQAVGVAAGQIGFGAVGISPFGLMLGPVANAAVGCAILGARLVGAARETLARVTGASLLSAARIHDRYPRFSALEALCNVASQQLPVVIIAAVAVGAEGGYVNLAMYAMQAPMAVIGTAISQVYMSRAPAEYRAGTLGNFTGNVIVQLVRIGVGPLIFLGIVSPSLFGFVFGPGWDRAGELVAWMTPWLLMQFLVVPVSLALPVTRNQKRALGLQIFGFVARVVTVSAAAFFAPDFMAETFAISGFVFYAIYLLVVARTAEIRWQAVKAHLDGALWFPIGWTLFAVMTALVATYFRIGS